MTGNTEGIRDARKRTGLSFLIRSTAQDKSPLACTPKLAEHYLEIPFIFITMGNMKVNAFFLTMVLTVIHGSL